MERIPEAETLPSDLVGRPRRRQTTWIGVQALSRLGRFTDPYAGTLPPSKQALADAMAYQPLDQQPQGERRASIQASLAPAPYRRHKTRKAMASEEEVKAEVEEENRQKAARYIADDKWEEATTSVWFPVGPRKRLWDMLMLFMLLYSIIVEPFRISFNMNAEGILYWFELLLSIIFVVDIGFTFNTAYLEAHLEGDNWVIDRAMIARNYIQGRFVIEILAAYPAELVDLVGTAAFANNAFVPANDEDTHIAVLRIMRLLRLLRVVRVLRELQAIYADVLLRMESRLQTNLAYFHLLGPLSILVYVMHLLACCFVVISSSSRNAGYENSWVTEYEGGIALEDNLRQRYLVALYWASGTATGLGTGVLPANEPEWLYVSCAHLVGVLVMGTVIGWIARAIEQSQSPIDKMIEMKTDVVKDITRWRAMPPELADHVIRFYSHYSRKHAAAVMDDEKALLDALAVAPSLRREVLTHLLGKSVALIPVFSRKTTDEFQLQVDPLLKPIVYEPRDLIFEQGSGIQGSAVGSAWLYFLNEGTIKASTTIAGHSRMLYSIREEGDLFGEHCLIDKKADVTCVAVARCDVFRISRSELLDLYEKFPEAKAEFAEYVLSTVLKHKCQRYFSLRISGGDHPASTTHGAALRIQLATFRRQNKLIRAMRPQELMPLLFMDQSERKTLERITAPIIQNSKRKGLGMAAAIQSVRRGSASDPSNDAVAALMKGRNRATVVVPADASAPATAAQPATIEAAPSSAATPALPPAVTEALARSEARTIGRLQKMDEHLAALREAIDANSVALRILVQDAEARQQQQQAGDGSGLTA